MDARKLHFQLKTKTKFADWITNRIEKYEFVEGVDFWTFSENLENGGKRKEYYLSIGMAKELAMVENNAAGVKISLVNYSANSKSEYPF